MAVAVLGLSHPVVLGLVLVLALVLVPVGAHLAASGQRAVWVQALS